MKKYFSFNLLTVFLLCLLTVSFASCNKDDEEEVTIPDESFIGIWNIYERVHNQSNGTSSTTGTFSVRQDADSIRFVLSSDPRDDVGRIINNKLYSGIYYLGKLNIENDILFIDTKEYDVNGYCFRGRKK